MLNFLTDHSFLLGPTDVGLLMTEDGGDRRLLQPLASLTDQYTTYLDSNREGAMSVDARHMADLGKPTGFEPGYRRLIVVVQGDSFNRSKIPTVVCVPLTSNLRWVDAPGNVLLDARATGLPKDSVANVSQVVTLDKSALKEHTRVLPNAKLDLVLLGIDIVLSR